MRPLSELGASEATCLHGLLFDVDDTLLTRGKLTEPAFSALHQLATAGLELIAVTGRSASFAEMIGQQWPIAGAIAENGALSVLPGTQQDQAIDPLSNEHRQRHNRQLQALCRDIQQQCPELRPSTDAHLRRSDFTYDIGEYRQPEPTLVERATEIARAQGAWVTRSSLHLHVSFERSDKATGAIGFLSARGVDETSARHRFAFIGDSDNDGPCFAAFHTTIAVNNFCGRRSVPPRYLTPSGYGRGFAEAAGHLCRLRRQ